MTLATFKGTLGGKQPDENLSDNLKALWYDAKGDWNKAHQLVQHKQDKNAAWIHAYLHRKEGDSSNANYWYYHAGKIRTSISFEKEWDEIATALIETNA